MNQLTRSLLLAIAAAAALAACTDQQATPGAAAPASASASTDASTLKVVSWGPKTTKAGATFNLQPDGNSGMFAEFSGDVPMTKFEGTIGGKPLNGVVASGKVVTATIPTEYLAKPGSYPVELVVPAQNMHIPVGMFTVEGDGAAAPADAPAAAPADAAPPTDATGATAPAGQTPETVTPPKP